MSGPHLYRLPSDCSAPDCPDDPVSVVVDEGVPTHVFCERHLQAITDPVLAQNEAGGLDLVVPER